MQGEGKKPTRLCNDGANEVARCERRLCVLQLHKTKLHSSMMFAALVLLQRLKACFLTTQDHRDIGCSSLLSCCLKGDL